MSLTESQFKVVEYIMEGGRTIEGFRYHTDPRVTRKSAKEMVYRVAERLGVEGHPDLRKIADKLTNVLRNELT